MGPGCRSSIAGSPLNTLLLSTDFTEGGYWCSGVPRVGDVYSRKNPDPQILELARNQAGVISQSQLEAVDFPPGAYRRWKQNWIPLVPGIHCLREPTWLSWCWAALLHAGPTGVVGGSAAAHLLGAVAGPPEQITVWHRRSSALQRIGDTGAGVTFRRAVRPGRGEPPRTPIEVTLLDLAGESTEDETVAAVTRAFSQGLTTPSRLFATLVNRQRTSRRALLTALCSEASRGIESVLEWRFLTVVVRAHRLPEPIRQQRLAAGTRSDAYWQDFGVVAELDGRLGHEQAFRDMARDNRLAMSGLQILRYGWHDVTHRPCEVAWQLREVLGSRGWVGDRGRCSRCLRTGLA